VLFRSPFNNATTIGFSVAEDGFVAIEVYDLTGRLVSTLTRPNRLFRRGFHEVSVDADQLASGVYLYHLRFTPSKTNGERYSETRKMLLVR
jgi:serine protease AprX